MCVGVSMKSSQMAITSEQATRFGRAEGVIAGRDTHQQRVFMSVLETEILQICGCLRNLNSADTGLQPQLFNRFVSDGQAGTGGVIVRHDRPTERLTT